MHEFKREVEMHGGMFHFVGAFFGDSPADSGHCSLALFTPVVISTELLSVHAAYHNIYLHMCALLLCSMQRLKYRHMLWDLLAFARACAFLN